MEKNNYDDLLTIPLNIEEESLIKVMGVGGGGCNAVNHLYSQGVEGVSFLVCNTDKMALGKSSVPAKLQLGPGWGAGGKPEKAEEYAEQNRHLIKEALDDGTQMLFITAGQGGGTGTGASPIVAEVARELNILTVGIVTIPFAFEGQPKIHKAMSGVAKLADQVDAILIINNQKLTEIYPDLDIANAFKRADDVVANSARAIAEIVTVPGYINTDFADVYNTLKDGKVAIMNVGRASGENRITQAIRNALESPLVNTSNVHGAKRILFQLYCSHEHAILMKETDQIHAFVAEVGQDVEVQWGISFDDSLDEDVRITIIATGYEVASIPSLQGLEGTVSIEEAIKENYKTEDKKEEKAEEPKAEAGKQAEETADANKSEQSIKAEPEDEEQEVVIDYRSERRTHTPSPDAANISIRIEEDDDTSSSNSHEEPRHFGWFRRK